MKKMKRFVPFVLALFMAVTLSLPVSASSFFISKEGRETVERETTLETVVRDREKTSPKTGADSHWEVYALGALVLAPLGIAALRKERT